MDDKLTSSSDMLFANVLNNKLFVNCNLLQNLIFLLYYILLLLLLIGYLIILDYTAAGVDRVTYVHTICLHLAPFRSLPAYQCSVFFNRLDALPAN